MISKKKTDYVPKSKRKNRVKISFGETVFGYNPDMKKAVRECKKKR